MGEKLKYGLAILMILCAANYALNLVILHRVNNIESAAIQAIDDE